MSKKRFIDTHFWSDVWVDNLSRDERYFFMYLLTNNKTSIAGVYEIPIKMIAFETDFEKNEVIEMFEKIKSKVRYIDGWVVMRNGIKNQNYRNSKIQRGIEIILEQCPAELLEFMDIPKDFVMNTTLPVEKPKLPLVFDDPSMSHDVSLHSDTDSEFDSDSNSELDAGKPHGPKQVLDGPQKRSYAKSMAIERESNARAENARTRKGGGLESARQVAARIKSKRIGGATA